MIIKLLNIKLSANRNIIHTNNTTRIPVLCKSHAIVTVSNGRKGPETESRTQTVVTTANSNIRFPIANNHKL